VEAIRQGQIQIQAYIPFDGEGHAVRPG